jgi:hypothetical protein
VKVYAFGDLVVGLFWEGVPEVAEKVNFYLFVEVEGVSSFLG